MKTINDILILAVIFTGTASYARVQAKSELYKEVFQSYFQIKDALVKSDAENASIYAVQLLAALEKMDMGKLGNEEHLAWMKVEKELKQDAKALADAEKISKQREFFIRLSENIYTLIKSSKPLEAVYYQHCPMANGGKGANWLSRENAIKNPYYGVQMMTCGRTVETIKL